MQQYNPTHFLPLLLIFLLPLAACEDEVVGDDEQTFEAELEAMNAEQLEDFEEDDFDGEATFTIEDGTVTAAVRVDGVASGIMHAQHIHLAAECPTQAADREDDSDEFVDVIEGLPVYGGILVPLDFDLSAQAAGAFPMAEDEKYDYEQSIPIGELVNSLRPKDGDLFKELPEGEPLNLAGRTVVVHGVPADTDLPESVQSLGGMPAHATLPIACGTIEVVD